MKTRRAEVTSADATLEGVKAYLPSNYTAHLEGDLMWPIIVIEGHDDAGWTLDGYVIPRLASGLIFAKENLNSSDRSPRWHDDIDEVVAFTRWYLEGSGETWTLAVDIIEEPWRYDDIYAAWQADKKESLNS